MTYQRPAYEEVTIAHGGKTVTLRPSLRAAVTLETRFGFPALFRALDEGNFTIISEIILTTAHRQDGAAFLSSLSGRPLASFIGAACLPLAGLVSMLIPAIDPKGKPTTNSDNPVSWPAYYADLYERATGWLGWTPAEAWAATPTEIERAYSGHITKLKAIHGDSEPENPTHDPREEISEVDARSGLDKLRANAKRDRA